MGRVVGRAADALILDWIKRRIAGETTLALAAEAGVSSSQVIQATNAVRDADIALCGDQVRGDYW